MSHDIQASWAATELARHLQVTPADCFGVPPAAAGLSIFASREGRTVWPFADGVLVIQVSPRISYRIAVEFKRANEGTHGMLTALGQSIAYVNKGYNGAIAVLPREYVSHSTPGAYTTAVLDNTVGRSSIGVFTYEDPDTTLASPFMGRLHCNRRMEVDMVVPVVPLAPTSVTETQWMHLREGSTTPSAFFQFLQISKALPMVDPQEPNIELPAGLSSAIARMGRGVVPLKYLSNSVNDHFRDLAWRNFWFSRVLTNGVMRIWNKAGVNYVSNDAATELFQSDGITRMVMFASRQDSIKSKLVNALNAGTITEDEAWEQFAQNVRKRAHSYREDIDSGLEHIGMLDVDGKPTDLGYRFIDLSERTGAPHLGVPRAMLGAAILKNGDLIALLHYIHRLSERLFRDNPLEFATPDNKLSSTEYRLWLEDQLANDLRVLHKVNPRGGVSRKPLQAEITLLRQFGFVDKYRISVGLEVNWPVVQEALDFVL